MKPTCRVCGDIVWKASLDDPSERWCQKCADEAEQRAREWLANQQSDCCTADVILQYSGGFYQGTNFTICNKCGKACDLVKQTS